MVASSETPSDADQIASSVLLSIKIECFPHSLVAPAPTMVEHVPLVLLLDAFSIARYQHNEAMITFEVGSNKTSISKARFSQFLGLSNSMHLVDPKSISSRAILEMFYQMGYLEKLAILSKFKKPDLPLMWNDHFALLFKSFSEWSRGQIMQVSFSAPSSMAYTLELTWIMVLSFGLN